MLGLKNVEFSYPGQSKILTYDLELFPGKTVAFDGPSGSGKSTLLDLIAGFLRPSKGEILLDAKDIILLSPEQRPVSILFQANNLFDHLSVRKNLELGVPKNIVDKNQLVQDALDEVGLGDLIGRQAARLSGGEKQRVALARTLLRDKPVLLLDEPYASLDRKNAEKMRQLVNRLTIKNSWHTLIVSHLEADRKSG